MLLFKCKYPVDHETFWLYRNLINSATHKKKNCWMYGESSWLSTQQPVKMRENKCSKNIFGHSSKKPMYLPDRFQTQTLGLQKTSPK